MNWFKENKFLGMLLVVTAVLAILLVVVGIGKKGKKEGLMAEVEEAKSDIARMRGMDPFPTPSSVKEKRANLKEVVTAANEAQQAALAYAPLVMDNISVAQFAELFEKTENELRELYGDDIVLPEDFHLGFEKYKGEAPNAKATGVLAYQMGAFDWLFRELAAAGISEVDNFVRSELPPERGEDWSGPKPTGKKKRNKKKGKRGARGAALPKIAKSLPIELTFSGREGSVRKALTSISNSDKYFFVIRALRAKNPGAIPSNRKLSLGKVSDRSAPEEPVEDGVDLFAGDAAAPAAEEKEEVVTTSERILERVAGGENLKIFIRADLLIFDKEPKFPEIK